jgi:virginiamycin B lyase
VAPAPDGGVWFSARRTGRVERIALGSNSSGSSPHGVIAGPDGAAWLTDSGQNAIVRVSWPAREFKLFPLPAGTPYANFNTSAFDGDGDLWFTGQAGHIGKLAVRTGLVSVQESPRGRGPYGICATPKGDIWWCSLAGSFVAQVDRQSDAGPRVYAVYVDDKDMVWASEWGNNAMLRFDPGAEKFELFGLPRPGCRRAVPSSSR